MSDLWSESRAKRREAALPLAARMRPRTLDEFAGQSHFLGPGKLLRRMIEADRLGSLILHGPPGTGKTTLAELIARHTRRHFERGNAAALGVKEVRHVLDSAQRRIEDTGQRTILFLDEVHRFNRAQQDVLLADVEGGVVTLIGATTENPFFAVNPALVSRSQVFQFEPLSEDDIAAVLRRALRDPERGLGGLDVEVEEEALRHWAVSCDGDARRALTALEIAAISEGAVPRGSGPGVRLSLQAAQESIQRKALVYDGTGDEHYDAASAFIKSMRGSDPDAALYWLAMMLVAGEDPRFIARRIAILASEDVGNADPQALVIAAAAFDVTHRIGLPECQLTLAQATIYMACAPKSNASTLAIGAALRDVRERRTLPVPKPLRDGHYAGAQRLGHAQGYAYPHDSPTGYVDQDYLGVDRTYYVPTDRGHERRIGQFLEWVRSQQAPRPQPPPASPA